MVTNSQNKLPDAWASINLYHYDYLASPKKLNLTIENSIRENVDDTNWGPTYGDIKFVFSLVDESVGPPKKVRIDLQYSEMFKLYDRLYESLNRAPAVLCKEKATVNVSKVSTSRNCKSLTITFMQFESRNNEQGIELTLNDSTTAAKIIMRWEDMKCLFSIIRDVMANYSSYCNMILSVTDRQRISKKESTILNEIKTNVFDLENKLNSKMIQVISEMENMKTNIGDLKSNNNHYNPLNGLANINDMTCFKNLNNTEPTFESNINDTFDVPPEIQDEQFEITRPEVNNESFFDEDIKKTVEEFDTELDQTLNTTEPVKVKKPKEEKYEFVKSTQTEYSGDPFIEKFLRNNLWYLYSHFVAKRCVVQQSDDTLYDYFDYLFKENNIPQDEIDWFKANEPNYWNINWFWVMYPKMNHKHTINNHVALPPLFPMFTAKITKEQTPYLYELVLKLFTVMIITLGTRWKYFKTYNYKNPENTELAFTTNPDIMRILNAYQDIFTYFIPFVSSAGLDKLGNNDELFETIKYIVLDLGRNGCFDEFSARLNFANNGSKVLITEEYIKEMLRTIWKDDLKKLLIPTKSVDMVSMTTRNTDSPFVGDLHELLRYDTYDNITNIREFRDLINDRTGWAKQNQEIEDYKTSSESSQDLVKYNLLVNSLHTDYEQKIVEKNCDSYIKAKEYLKNNPNDFTLSAPIIFEAVDLYPNINSILLVEYYVSMHVNEEDEEEYKNNTGRWGMCTNEQKTMKTCINPDTNKVMYELPCETKVPVPFIKVPENIIEDEDIPFDVEDNEDIPFDVEEDNKVSVKKDDPPFDVDDFPSDIPFDVEDTTQFSNSNTYQNDMETEMMAGLFD